MVRFVRIHLVLALTSAFELLATVASAQDTVPASPEVSSNHHTDATDFEPNLASAAHSPVAGIAVAAPAQQLYPFRVRGPEATRPIEVRSTYDVAIARCVGECVLNLPAADYKAVFLDANGREQELLFSVEGSGGVELRDADQSAASTGLSLGIGGIVLAVAGMVVMDVGLVNACIMSECTKPNQGAYGAMVLGGFATMAAGAVMTPIGWVMWARNRHPRAREISFDLHAAAIPTRNGAILGLSGQF